MTDNRNNENGRERMTATESSRFAMTIPELAASCGVDGDGYTYDHSARLYSGVKDNVEAFADALFFRGASFSWADANTVAVK